MNQTEGKVTSISEREKMLQMMERMEASNAAQERYARKQYRMSQITAIASVLMMITVIYTASVLIPKGNATFRNLDYIMQDLQVITSELAEADVKQMLQDVDSLVVSSEQNIHEAMEKLNAIDIDSLNTAIRNLSDAVEPFANFFKKFQ